MGSILVDGMSTSVSIGGRSVMKTGLEQWLDQYVLDEGAQTLFQESAAAYKAGCDRAAVIMAYLGILSALRGRILESSVPSGFDASAWAGSQKEVRDDDRWDSSVFGIVTQVGAPQAFRITNDQRIEFQYFRALRNKCAHGKGGHINSAHVESLWAFAMDNLPKIVVNGSLQGAIQSTLEHFDQDLTPKDKPFDELATSINTSLRADEVAGYLDVLLAKATVRLPGEAASVVQDWFVEVTNGLAAYLDDGHQPALSAWLGTEEHFAQLQQLMRLHPQSNAAMGIDAKAVRRLWHTASTFDVRDLRLYLHLRRKKLIPSDQVDESIQFVAENATAVEGLSSEELEELAEMGFWKCVRTFLLASVVIRNAEFTYANRRAQLVRKYLDRCGIDEEFAEAIRQMETSYTPYDVENVVIGYLHEHGTAWETLKSAGGLPAGFASRVEERPEPPLFGA